MRLRIVAALLSTAALTACFPGAHAEEKVVEIRIHHSAFLPSRMTFDQGTTVRFVIHNGDPIDHEFIVGDQSVQDRHEVGRQRHHHGEVPGEVSVPAGATRTTTYTFDEPATLIIGCHLPRHFAYGMRGKVMVTP